MIVGNYKLNETGKYYLLRARFNDRDFTPNRKAPRGDLVRIYTVWLKNNIRDRKRVLLFKTWGNSFTGIAIKDKVCIDNLFSFNDYEKIKFKKEMEFRN